MTKDEELKLYKMVADFYIDRSVEYGGPLQTIQELKDFGLNKEDLLTLKFDKDDIDDVFEEE